MDKVVDHSDSHNVLWGLLSAIILWPVLGLILYFEFRKSRVQNTKAILAGVVHSLALVFGLFVIEHGVTCADLIAGNLTMATGILAIMQLIVFVVFCIWHLVIYCRQLNK